MIPALLLFNWKSLATEGAQATPLVARNLLKRKEKTMTIEICWLDDLTKAQETARKVNKPILLDFYNPQ